MTALVVSFLSGAGFVLGGRRVLRYLGEVAADLEDGLLDLEDEGD